MSQSKFLFLVVFLFSIGMIPLFTWGQTPLTEFEVPPRTREWSGFVSGDSILLRYKHPIPPLGEEFSRYVWISPQGARHEVELPEQDDKVLCAVLPIDNSRAYYFLDLRRKSIGVSCVLYDTQSGTKKINDNVGELQGKLIGTFVDRDLYIITAVADERIIRVSQVVGQQVVNQKEFPINIDVVKDRNPKLSFVASDIPAKPAEIIAPIKFFKTDSLIYISMDDPVNPYGHEYPPKRFFRTTVIKLNLLTQKSVMKSYPEPTPKYFTSAIFDGHLYRIVSDEGLRLEVYELESGKKMVSEKFPAKAEYPDHISFHRNTENRVVRKGHHVRSILSDLSSGFVLPEKSSSDVILTIGTQTESKPVVPLLGVAGLFVGSIIRDLTEQPLYHAYFYLKGSPQTGFQFVSQTNLRQQLIDEYEIEKFNSRIRYKFKAYLNGRDCTYGIYQEVKSKRIHVVKFD